MPAVGMFRLLLTESVPPSTDSTPLWIPSLMQKELYCVQKQLHCYAEAATPCTETARQSTERVSPFLQNQLSPATETVPASIENQLSKLQKQLHR
jgi:hypothetical protein